MSPIKSLTIFKVGKITREKKQLKFNNPITESRSYFKNVSGDEQHQHQPQSHLHILPERRPGDPGPNKPYHHDQTHPLTSSTTHLSLNTSERLDHQEAPTQLQLFLHQEEIDRMGAVSVDEGMVTVDDNSENVASDFGDDGDDGHMPFSELLSDPEKDEGQDQDPPSSTTGEPGDKPGKRANQGKI